MKVLIVFAHPDRRSLNGSFLKDSVEQLESDGHEVKVSDLYQMKWNPVISEADFQNHPKGERLLVAQASGSAYKQNQLTNDVTAEHEKLQWADLVIFQFPLWWYSMPAIMKGWVDRVFSYGLAYGVGEYNDKTWGDRFGSGKFQDKKAMLLVTVGGNDSHYSARGIAGPMDDLMFPINHGILYYPGFQVLPAFYSFGTNRLPEEKYQKDAKRLKEYLHNIEKIEPIPFRSQNGGDYTIPQLELKPEIGNSSDYGFKLHHK